MSAQCFVIGPIGAEGSDERKHSDDVFDLIITPAVEACGITAVRSDHLPEPGHIMDQMMSTIARADFCIVIATGLNPNVFYELGICHAVNKAVIILNLQGTHLPFDIRDFRCIEYNFNLNATFNHTYASQLQKQIETLRDAEWQSPNALPYVNGTFLDPSAINKDGAVDIKHLLFLLSQASSNADMMGVSLAQWRDMQIGRMLEKKAQNGCRIRIMHLDPSHPALIELVEQTSPEQNYEQTVQSIQMMSTVFERFSQLHENIKVLKISSGVPSINLLCTDKTALAITYLHSKSLRQCPLWQECKKGTVLYKTLSDEFEALWNRNQN